MKKYFLKILLALVGIISALIFIEVTLQIISLITEKTEYSRTSYVEPDDLKRKRILCIGDSMTYGSGVEFYETYPAVLQKFLNNIYPGKYVVYNIGHHGVSSSMVLSDLENNIKQYKPDIVLIMIGSCDNFILEKSNSYLFADSTIQRYLTILNINFNKLKIVKLFSVFFLHDNDQIGSKNSFIEHDKSYSLQIELWTQKCNKKLNPEELIREGEAFVKIHPNVEMLQQIAFLYQQKGDFEKSFIYFNKALDIECSVRTVQFLIEGQYIRQKDYKTALAVLEKYKKVFIREKKLDLFLEMKSFCSNINENSESKTLLYNYSKIYSILNKKNIKIIFLGYPQYDKTENELAVIKQNLKAEVLFLFADIVKDKDILLRYDGYCTKYGYEKIAKMVFARLQALKWIE